MKIPKLRPFKAFIKAPVIAAVLLAGSGIIPQFVSSTPRSEEPALPKMEPDSFEPVQTGAAVYYWTSIDCWSVRQDATRSLYKLEKALYRNPYLQATVKVYDPESMEAARDISSISGLFQAPSWSGIAMLSRLSHDPWDGKALRATLEGGEIGSEASRHRLPFLLTNRVPESAELANDIATAMSYAPKNATRMAAFQGHGWDTEVGHLHHDTIDDAFRKAHAERLKLIDFRDACRQGELKILMGLAESGVKISYGSSVQLSNGTLFYEDIMGRLAEPGTPEEKAKEIIEVTGKRGTPETFSAFNLQKIKVLWQSMQAVCDSVKQYENNPEELIRRAFNGSKSNRSDDFCDLQTFLVYLKNNTRGPKTKRDIEKAKNDLLASIIAKTTENRPPFDHLGGMGLHWTTLELLYGSVRQPWDKTFFPRGSTWLSPLLPSFLEPGFINN